MVMTMSGKARPSLRRKTLENVRYSNLSETDKQCIYAVFAERDVVRCKDCAFSTFNNSSETYKCKSMRGLYRAVLADEFCSWGERKDDAICEY